MKVQTVYKLVTTKALDTHLESTFDGMSLERAIEYLQEILEENKSKYDRIYLDREPGYYDGDHPKLNIIGAISETDDAYQERMKAQRKAEKEAREKRKQDEKELYLKLKAKYEANQ